MSTNCTTCRHKTRIRNACWRLCGGPPNGEAGIPIRRMADRIRTWRAQVGLPRDGDGYQEPTEDMTGCPGWEEVDPDTLWKFAEEWDLLWSPGDWEQMEARMDRT